MRTSGRSPRSIPNPQSSIFNSSFTPLYLTRHRLYSPSLRRFLSSDPVGLSGGLNLYAYANGNPLAYIDPLGLSPFDTGVPGFFESFGTSEHWRDSWEFYKGEGDAVVSTAVGIYNFVRHPIQTLEGIGGFIGTAIGDPSGTWDTLYNNLLASLSDPRSAGELAGHGLITIGTVMAPFASSAKSSATVAVELEVRMSPDTALVIEGGTPSVMSMAEANAASYLIAPSWGDLKTLSVGRLKGMGVDAHELKADIVGKTNISRYNIATDKTGAIVLTPVNKGGSPVVETGININDAAGIYPIRWR